IVAALARETAAGRTHQDHHDGRLHPGHPGAEETRKAPPPGEGRTPSQPLLRPAVAGPGALPGEVAALLGVYPRTVRNWLQLYQRGGLEALCTLEYKGAPG